MDSTNPKIEDYLAGKLEVVLFNAVAERPYGVTSAELVDILYGHRRDGGPEWAANSISVILHRLNKKIAVLGLRIRGWGGPGSKFHLYIRRV